MTKDERDGLIELAKQTCMIQDGEVWYSASYHNCDVYTEDLLYFALLVEAKAIEREREACAKRLETVGCDHCAENIRARGQA